MRSRPTICLLYMYITSLIICGSVLLWWHCNILCTSGFEDDVMLSYNWPYGDVTLRNQHSCCVAALVASSSELRRAPRLDEPFVKEAHTCDTSAMS